MREHTTRLLILLAVGVLLFSACQPRVPKQYLQPDEMEDLLYDYYVSQAISPVENGHQQENMDYHRRYAYEAVLRKYNLTEAEFDSSLAYYYNNAERLKVIYQNLQKRLGDDAIALGASEGEVDRFTQSLTGDTADVWEGRRSLVLAPVPPLHVVQFTQKADTSFHQGDSFLFTLAGRYLSPGNQRATATACLALTYANDSVVSQTMTVNTSGVTSIRIATSQERVKKIDGFVYMMKRERQDDNNDMTLLLVDRIRLLRFHKTDTEKDTDKKAQSEKETNNKPQPEREDNKKPQLKLQR